MVIPKSIFQIIRQRAQFQCEYCHYPELLSSAPLSVDHLQPQSKLLSGEQPVIA
jgi:hypothetical protein